MHCLLCFNCYFIKYFYNNNHLQNIPFNLRLLQITTLKFYFYKLSLQFNKLNIIAAKSPDLGELFLKYPLISQSKEVEGVAQITIDVTKPISRFDSHHIKCSFLHSNPEALSIASKPSINL